MWSRRDPVMFGLAAIGRGEAGAGHGRTVIGVCRRRLMPFGFTVPGRTVAMVGPIRQGIGGIEGGAAASRWSAVVSVRIMRRSAEAPLRQLFLRPRVFQSDCPIQDELCWLRRFIHTE